MSRKPPENSGLSGLARVPFARVAQPLPLVGGVVAVAPTRDRKSHTHTTRRVEETRGGNHELSDYPSTWAQARHVRPGPARVRAARGAHRARRLRCSGVDRHERQQDLLEHRWQARHRGIGGGVKEEPTHLLVNRPPPPRRAASGPDPLVDALLAGPIPPAAAGAGAFARTNP